MITIHQRNRLLTVPLLACVLIACVLLACVLIGFVAGAGCGRSQQDPAPDSRTADSMDPPHRGLASAADFTAGVPVICYHYFRARFDPVYTLKFLGTVILGLPTLGEREFWTTPINEFEKHLRYFRDHNIEVLTLDQVATAVTNRRPLPQRAVILTIDDADESVYRLAWPLLQKYGYRAHLFVPTSLVGQRWDSLRICTWDQLREMSLSGNMVIDSHTSDLHFKLKTPRGREPAFLDPELIPPAVQLATRNRLQARLALTESADMTAAAMEPSDRWNPVKADLMTSRLDIIAEIQTAPRWLAWPYGFAHGDLDSIARHMGFSGTVSLAPRAFTALDTNLSAGRYTLTATTTLDMIKSFLPPD